MSRILSGKVVSDASDKTIVVQTQRRKTHPIYDKRYLVTKKLHAHDAKNEAKKGDKVEIIEVKPISKHKSWALHKVLEKQT
jgi:small subunit ribosomal protein S17